MATSTPSDWNIRFGQIFKQRLEALENQFPNRYTSRFQDCFFFHPDEDEFLQAKKFSKTPYKDLDLNQNISLYRKFFTTRKLGPSLELDTKIGNQLDTTFILVPGFAHQLIKPSLALDEACQSLRSLGFDIRYANYSESLSSSKACGKKLCEIISQWEDLRSNLIFFGYSFGILVILDLIQEKGFRNLKNNVRSIVSIGGALGGAASVDQWSVKIAKQVLQVYRKVIEKRNNALEARLVKALRESLEGNIPWASGVRQIMERVESFSTDLTDLPEGLESLGRANPKWMRPETFPEDIDFFSISAVCPRSKLRGDSIIPNNPDDLFLYLTSKNLYKTFGPYNDAQLLTKDTKFPNQLQRPAHHLATLNCDHWGLAMPRVLSKAYEDSFPRPAMMEALILLLNEFYS